MQNRYEEYTNLTKNLPLIFKPRLHRSKSIYSDQANWHENLEIQFCNEGSGRVLADGKQIAFQEGDTVVLNSNVIHHTGTDGDLVYSCIIIDQKFCIDADIDPRSICFSEHLNDPRIAKLFDQIEIEYCSDSPTRVARLRMLVLSLLIILREEYVDICTHPQISYDSNESVKAAINFIRKNYASKISLEDIAKNTYSNKYVLSRQFKRIMGQTIVEYTNAYRIKQASAIIAEGATVSEAARLCGFNNLSFFSKTFKRYTGHLPIDMKNK